MGVSKARTGILKLTSVWSWKPPCLTGEFVLLCFDTPGAGPDIDGEEFERTFEIGRAGGRAWTFPVEYLTDDTQWDDCRLVSIEWTGALIVHAQ